MNQLQHIILNVIQEMDNSSVSMFGTNATGPTTFQTSDMRGDLEASKASDDMTKRKSKRSKKRQRASNILRRLPLPADCKKMF